VPYYLQIAFLGYAGCHTNDVVEFLKALSYLASLESLIYFA